jgi:hypothetical protein
MKKAELGKTSKGCQQALFLKREIAELIFDNIFRSARAGSQNSEDQPELERFEEILFQIRGEGVQTQHQSSQPRQPPDPPTFLTFWHLHHFLSR